MTAVFTAAVAITTYAYVTYKSIEESKKGREATERCQQAS